MRWVRRLQQKKIAGAALDVIADEPPEKDHPLFKLDNVLWTPHLGAVTLEASERGEWGAARRSHPRARKQTAEKSRGRCRRSAFAAAGVSGTISEE